MLRRYLVPIAALCMLYHAAVDAAVDKQVIKSNARVQMTPGKRSPKRLPLTRNHNNVDDILEAINEHRRNVIPGPSSNMEYMEWDDNLAYMASDWSALCVFEHGDVYNYSPYEWVGQNLYLASWYVPDTEQNGSPTVVEAINNWNSENIDYNYDDDSCTGSACGHYTQNVWAASNRIGCAVQFCENGVPDIPWPEATLITCNYGPGGNYFGEAPYSIGLPCSECYSTVASCSTEIGDEIGLCRTPCDLECENGGTCYSYDGSFAEFCFCEPQWTGDTCREEVTCERPCENDGVCILFEGDPICYCLFGYEGDTCETAPPTCDLDCGDYGRCDHDYDGSEFCACNTGWTGLYCDTPLTCSVICENGGHCSDDGEDRCDCLEGFTGQSCRRITAYCCDPSAQLPP